jgi:hypothetical protein
VWRHSLSHECKSDPKYTRFGSAREATETYFRDGWHLRDLRYNVSLPKLVRMGVVDDFECVPSGVINRHPYYREFLWSAGLRWFAGVLCGLATITGVCRSTAGSIKIPFRRMKKEAGPSLASSCNGRDLCEVPWTCRCGAVVEKLLCVSAPIVVAGAKEEDSVFGSHDAAT